MNRYLSLTSFEIPKCTLTFNWERTESSEFAHRHQIEKPIWICPISERYVPMIEQGIGGDRWIPFVWDLDRNELAWRANSMALRDAQTWCEKTYTENYY